eukprot:4481604-Lingulodinium_polyedra.AAC.1
MLANPSTRAVSTGNRRHPNTLHCNCQHSCCCRVKRHGTAATWHSRNQHSCCQHSCNQLMQPTLAQPTLMQPTLTQPDARAA